MTNPSREEQIIAEAQASVTARRTQRENPWRYAFGGFAGVLLLILLAWPGTPMQWKLYSVVHGVCAQIHNVEIGGLQLPMCARNTGIYGSTMLTTLLLLVAGRGRATKLPPWGVTITLLVMAAIMVVDGFNSLLLDIGAQNLYTPRNEVRTLTGIGLGIGLAVVLLLIGNLSLRAEVDSDRRLIGGWGELLAIIAINIVVFSAMYANVGLMFWPIAIIAWSGLVGTLFAVNVLIIALIMGYDGRVGHLSQLARPATIAIFTTTVLLGVMAWARFQIETVQIG